MRGAATWDKSSGNAHGHAAIVTSVHPGRGQPHHACSPVLAWLSGSNALRASAAARIAEGSTSDQPLASGTCGSASGISVQAITITASAHAHESGVPPWQSALLRQVHATGFDAIVNNPHEPFTLLHRATGKTMPRSASTASYSPMRYVPRGPATPHAAHHGAQLQRRLARDAAAARRLTRERCNSACQAWAVLHEMAAARMLQSW